MVGVADMAQTKFLSLEGLTYFWTLLKDLLNEKQPVIEDLATIRNKANIGAELADKVDSIEEGAEVNVIERLVYKGEALSVFNKSVVIPVPDLSDYLTVHTGYTRAQIDNKLTAAMRYKGSVSTYTNLPVIGVQVGDFYNVADTGANYAWTGTEWDETGQVIDLTPYALSADLVAVTNAEIDTILAS